MNQPTIFYADDDLDDRELFKEAAVNFQGTVRIFENGEDMILCLQDFIPAAAIVFVDLNMPGKSGFDVVRGIKDSKNLHNIPVIVLSTASDDCTVKKGRCCWANYYIQKPNSLAKLRSSLQYAFNIDWGNFRPSYREFVHK